MAEIAIAVAGKVAEYSVAPIGRQLGYLFCYRARTDDLCNKDEMLRTARDDLQVTVDEAKRKGEKIRSIVEEWLTRVDQITGEAEELMKKQNQSCLNLKSRYQLGREATKKAKVIVEIQEARNFPDGVSYHVPPRAVTFRHYECYDSRSSTLDEIMDALRDDTVKLIGVWGMGGVGKTTLVKQVAEQAKQQNLFTTQVYVDVSWTREDAKFEEGISSIQQHIAEMLGLELKEKTIPARAGKLMERLKCEKILIILDDLWKEVTLEDVGIPSCHKDCKIVLASRQESTLSHMEAQKRYPLRHLEEGEAWQLFKRTAGDSVENDRERKPIAVEIVKQCGGLPIAIVTIAKTLKERSVAVWKNALRELKSTSLGASSSNNKEEDPVYKCLALSYNHLKDDELKSLFLLCGCLSYGDIPMDQLLRYALGLDCFDRIKSMEEARDKLVTLVSDLKASSLLLDGEGKYRFERRASSLLFMDAADCDGTVRMHDLVRDVARNIASKDPHRFVVIEDVPSEEDWSKVHESKFISLNYKAVRELPHRLVCPKLQFFLLQNYSLSLNIPADKFFEGMNQLKVLDLSGVDFESLPSVLQSLMNLRTLCLDWCRSLKDIAGIGQLKKLHVLSMRGSAIRQLPQDMAQLTNLRLLNLNGCQKLEVIPRNILSKLSRLECLFMRLSFSKWAPEEDSDNGELSNIARLSELNRLDNLTTIEIKIPDAKLVPEEDKFFQNLTSFAIFIGNLRQWKEISSERSKILMLEGGDGSLLLRNGMRKLLEKAKEIKLSNLKGSLTSNNDSIKGLFSFSPPSHVSFHYLKCLSISDCEGNVTSILTGDGVLFGEKVLFPNLKELNIKSFSMLKMIWHPQLSYDGPLDKLQVLSVSDCPCLVNLIPSHLMQSLQNLKKVMVINCKVLERVFGHGESNGENRILPKIEILMLQKLPKLRHLFDTQGSDDNMRYFFSHSKFKDFHHMKELHIIDCGMPLDEKVSFSSNLEVLKLERVSKLNEIEFALKNPVIEETT